MFIQKLMRERGEPVPPEDSLLVAKEVKELYSYTSPDILKEFNKYDAKPEKHFKRHTGVQSKTKKEWSCDVGYERFLGPEIFFNPEVRLSLSIYISISIYITLSSPLSLCIATHLSLSTFYSIPVSLTFTSLIHSPSSPSSPPSSSSPSSPLLLPPLSHRFSARSSQRLCRIWWMPPSSHALLTVVAVSSR